MKKGYIIRSFFIHLIAIIIAILALIPFVWMISASIMEIGESAKFPPRFIPSKIDLSHYLFLFQNLDMARYFFNSLALSILVTLISLLFNSMAAYAFAKLRFGIKNRLFKILLSLMIVPGQVTIIFYSETFRIHKYLFWNNHSRYGKRLRNFFVKTIHDVYS